jgi:WD40 repeat protein
VAQKHKSLHHIREAGANLQRYMQKRAKIVAPLGTGVSTVTSWSTDLIRVVSKFGRNILDAPSQILLLVPAMCPRNSIIHKQFANRNPEFRVLGIAEDFWADAISYIEHLGSRPTAISMGARYFGVGRESGQIHVYDNETFEQVTEFSHGEPIKALKFSISGNWLIASGSSLLKLWNLEYTAGRIEPVWTKEVEQSCLSFYFADDDETVMTVSSTSVLRIPINGDMDEEDVEANVEEIPLQPPVGGDESLDKETVLHSVSFSPDGDFVAFTHDDKPISIWSATSGEYLGSCTRQAGHDARHVERLLFNLNPDLPFIVVTYKEGELGLIDYNMLREVRSVKAEPYALACTPDGHTLATGDAKGKIQLWDFETLTLIYVINYLSTSVRDLRFSKDGSRLVDLRETHSVVWEPAALLRSSDEEDSSSISGTSVSYRAPAVVEDYDDKAQITSLVLYPNKPFAIVGHHHGVVESVNLHTGQKAGEIVTLGNSRVTQLAVHQSQLLACATSDQSIRVSMLDIDADMIKESKVLLQVDDFGERVIQVLFSESGNSFLACGERMTKVWARNSSDTDGFTLMGPSASPETDCWRYLSSHEDPDSFELIDKRIDDIVRHADAGLPGKLKRSNTIGSENHNFSRIVNALVDPGTGYLMIEYEGALATRQLLILKRTTAQPAASDPRLLSPPTSPDPSMLSPPLEGMSVEGPPQLPLTDNYRLLLHLKAYQIKMLLGVYEGKAVYLGPRLWIRTCDLHHLNGSEGQKPVKRRHFFIPHEYIGGSYHVQAMVGQEGEVVFPRRGELAVVRGGITT